MSFEEFQEFRKQIRAQLDEMKRDYVRYPRFNTDYSVRLERARRREKEFVYAEEWHIGEKIEGLQSSERCCLAARFREGFLRCNRRRSERVLTPLLERMAVLKRLNLAISDEDPHKGICLFHWRLIKYGRPDRPMKEEEVKGWDAPESRLEKIERDDDILSDDNESCTSYEPNYDGGEGNEGGGEGQGSKDRPCCSKTGKPVSSHNREGEQQHDSDDDDTTGLSTLSAASLRRYRKFFMIPTKASASKHAMLEGVESHFERLPVQANDTIAFFIYTARNRMNTVE
ncbi:hypothetical protein V3C99_001293 [Haemonchus contortus]